MKLILTTIVLILSACAATQPVERTFPLGEVSADLRIDPTSLLLYHRCFHAIGPKGTSSAHYHEAACLRNNERFIFAQRQRPANRYVETSSLPLADLKAVRLGKNGAARQIQLETTAGVHMVILLLDDGLPRINSAANEGEYAFLARRGLPAAETSAYISNSNRGPVFVPLIVK